jgi:hypothetical protein
MTKEEKFALCWCYSRAMDYVEKHSPTLNHYEHHTGTLDLIVDDVNITEVVKNLLGDNNESERY